MSRARFLADHNFSDTIIAGVRNHLPEVQFTLLRAIGLDRSPDPEVLAYAQSHGLVVVTHDTNTMPAHFTAGLMSGKEMPGLVLIPQTAPPSYVIEDMVMFWSVLESEEMAGLIHYLPYARTMTRVPLK